MAADSGNPLRFVARGAIGAAAVVVALSSAVSAHASSASVSASATNVAVDEIVTITYTVSSTGGDFFEAWLIRDGVAGIDVCSSSTCSVEEAWSAPGTHTYKVEVREFDQTTGQSSIAATSSTISVTWKEAVPASPSRTPSPSPTPSPRPTSAPSPTSVVSSSAPQGQTSAPLSSPRPSGSFASPSVASTPSEGASSPVATESVGLSTDKGATQATRPFPGLPLIAGTVAVASGGTIAWWTLWPLLGDIARRRTRQQPRHAKTPARAPRSERGSDPREDEN